MGSQSLTGYVDDVPYTFHFTRELAPAWLDFVVTLHGFEAPSRTHGFTWCELGCGQGLTAAIFAGTHPTGDFHGIDAYAPHIERARRLCAGAGVYNLTLHATDFASACEQDLPPFDYIVAHGVYTWIDAQGKGDMRRFIDRHLKPGGVVFVSYNSMPGWANDSPFQFLVREVARTTAGSSTQQFVAAVKQIDALTAAGAPALASSYMATGGLEKLRQDLPNNYFAHEFLPSAWQPLYVTQVRADMAGLGLVPAGSATVRENFDSFVLTRAAREALADIADADVRELARDFFLDQRFRRDVFVRGARRISDEERDQRLMDSVFDLQHPVGLVEYAMKTQAGTFDFDNPTTRNVIDAFRTGPKRLADMPSDAASEVDPLSGVLALCAANQIRPVEATSANVAKLNRALLEHIGGTESLRFVALPSGTGVAVSQALAAEPRAGEVVSVDRLRWREFVSRWNGGTVER
ncbi:MAG TPA: class I SAM-dependent methyltransferase [Gemmatimonadaceae bacterium]